MPHELDGLDQSAQPENLTAQAELAAPGAELVEILRGVSSEVLETMFFSEALPADCEHDRLGTACTARVAFSGSHSGQMLVAVSGEAADSIASGFMGLDPGETGETERGQVILELGNIFCGAILSRVWPESRLQLEAPELTAWEDGPEYALHCCLAMPEGMLAISIRMCETPGSVEPA